MSATDGPARQLQRLGRRLIVLFTLVAVLAIAGFAVALLLADTAARSRELDARLLGQASRASALVYVESGGVRTEAVQDDVVATGDSLAVFERTSDGRVRSLYVTGPILSPSVKALARSAVRDGAERGTRRSVDDGAGTLRAVGLPWFDGTRVRGSVVVAAPPATVGSSPLLWPVVGGGTLLAIVLVGLASWSVHRSLRPAAVAVLERDRFTAMAAHELRTPIARIRAGAEALERTTPTDPAQAAALRSLVEVADGAGKVVANLLLAARIEHGSMSPRREEVRLDHLAADAEHLDPSVVADVTGPVVVTADPDLLRHAVDNLVQNALRHGRVEGRDLLVTVQVRSGADAAGPVLRVSDDGAGLPPDLDVVRPFTGTGRGGAGLGLSLVAWIAEQHGADLRLRRDDPGTTVEIDFPPSAS